MIACYSCRTDASWQQSSFWEVPFLLNFSANIALVWVGRSNIMCLSSFGKTWLEKLLSPLPAGTPLSVTEEAACSQVDLLPIVQSIIGLLSKMCIMEIAPCGHWSARMDRFPSAGNTEGSHRHTSYLRCFTWRTVMLHSWTAIMLCGSNWFKTNNLSPTVCTQPFWATYSTDWSYGEGKKKKKKKVFFMSSRILLLQLMTFVCQPLTIYNHEEPDFIFSAVSLQVMESCW